MILSPEATEAEATETVKRISDSITEAGGSISQQDNWGVRRLAYPIQRFIEGNYFITRCSMEAQAVVELNTTLNAAQDVLRHLVFRLDKSDIAAMEAQAERERAAQEEAERRAAAERAARERDEARRLAMEQAAAAQAATVDTAPDSVENNGDADESAPDSAEGEADAEERPVAATGPAEAATPSTE